MVGHRRRPRFVDVQVHFKKRFSRVRRQNAVFQRYVLRKEVFFCDLILELKSPLSVDRSREASPCEDEDSVPSTSPPPASEPPPPLAVLPRTTTSAESATSAVEADVEKCKVTVATQTGQESTTDLTFNPEKMTQDEHCYECKVKYRDPKPKDLVMYLHAWKYRVSWKKFLLFFSVWLKF